MTGERGWLSDLVDRLTCPICDARYGRDDLIVSGPNGDYWYVDCHCHTCGRRSFCAVTAFSLELPAAPASARLTMDDVLEAHRLLREYAGDAIGLFATPTR